MNDLALPHAGTPSTCSRAATVLGRWLLKMGGWKLRGQMPPARKMVVIAVPHTSNWDLLWLLAAAWSLRLHIHWMGKLTLFFWPLGPVLRRLGGIPVERSVPGRLVAQIVDRIAESDSLVVVIPPEGTRGYRDHWKSGFYWIAHHAGIAIICSFLDYGKRETGLGPAIVPTGDVARDMDRIRAFYAPIAAKYPGSQSTVRLKEENQAESKESP